MYELLSRSMSGSHKKLKRMFSNLHEGRKGERQKEKSEKQTENT